MNRAQWKVYWRQLRIIRRESWKAFEDQMLFGRSILEIGPEVPDLIRHVPLNMVLV